MMEPILNNIFEIIGIIAGAGIAYLTKVGIDFIKEKKLENFVTSMVKAADQLYKDVDPDGNIRMDYVVAMLVGSGYKLTEELKGLIESKVYDVNLDGPKEAKNDL